MSNIRHTKDPEHVAAGYKATIHNPHVSQEAKEHARKELHKMGIHDIDTATHDVPKSSSHPQPGFKESEVSEIRREVEDLGENIISEEGSHGKNEGNVIGGYKATLKNPHVSESAKRHAEQVLEERGVDVKGYEQNL